MNTFKAITTVYSYYMPEIRELITDLTREYPHDVLLRSISPGLDDFEQPIIDKLVDAHEQDVPHLAKFTHRYPTSGSEEGIREYMTFLQSQGIRQIYVWEGDYEGYRETAKTRNIDTVEVDYDCDPATLSPGHWFLSNPTARNGMIVPADKIHAITEADHRVFYDLAYLGATNPGVFDVSHPNIVAAVISFSKPYGLFYYRVGFTFSCEPIPALYANKWFKNVYGLLIAERILDRLDRAAMTRKYKALQADIVEQINHTFGVDFSASDAFLLAKLSAEAGAQLPAEQLQMIERFRRGDWYRFCLTPYLLEWEAGNEKI